MRADLGKWKLNVWAGVVVPPYPRSWLSVDARGQESLSLNPRTTVEPLQSERLDRTVPEPGQTVNTDTINRVGSN